ncbi:uncharacterized protein LOC134825315 isoform X1 [Bolinopsis microptera]|uniref:uncharacterized protein LOC134825315 isoform X1 n=1 Tax=Bolinopsis microptera TaxID=2820187 RepID=UPI00307AC598
MKQFHLTVAALLILLVPDVINAGLNELEDAAKVERNHSASKHNYPPFLRAKDCRPRKHNVQDCSCLQEMFVKTQCIERLGEKFINHKYKDPKPSTCVKHFNYCYGFEGDETKTWYNQCCRSMLCYMKLRTCV